MNENRNVFALNGLTGFLIAVVLLLSILAWFTVMGINTQNANATNFYKIVNEKEVKMFDTETRNKHYVDVK